MWINHSLCETHMFSFKSINRNHCFKIWSFAIDAPVWRQGNPTDPQFLLITVSLADYAPFLQLRIWSRQAKPEIHPGGVWTQKVFQESKRMSLQPLAGPSLSSAGPETNLLEAWELGTSDHGGGWGPGTRETRWTVPCWHFLSRTWTGSVQMSTCGTALWSHEKLASGKPSFPTPAVAKGHPPRR